MKDIKSIQVGDRIPAGDGHFRVVSIQPVPDGGWSLELVPDEDVIINGSPVGVLNAELRTRLQGSKAPSRQTRRPTSCAGTSR